MERTAAIVRIHRPVLTEQERARSMEVIRKAAVDLLIAREKVRKEKAYEHHYH